MNTLGLVEHEQARRRRNHKEPDFWKRKTNEELKNEIRSKLKENLKGEKTKNKNRKPAFEAEQKSVLNMNSLFIRALMESTPCWWAGSVGGWCVHTNMYVRSEKLRPCVCSGCNHSDSRCLANRHERASSGRAERYSRAPE